MKKPADLAAAQQRLVVSQMKPVRLRVAASVVHNQLARAGRFSMRGPDYIAALNEAASMLAQVADIYHVTEGQKVVRLAEDELLRGKFEDGGNLFRAESGTVYRSLCVRRGEVVDGLAVLQQACKTLDDAAVTAAAGAVLRTDKEPGSA